jgi:hypothetical protein
LFIEKIDNEFWRAFLPHIWKDLDLPDYMYDEVLECITDTNTTLEYKIKYNKSYRKIFRAFLSGTVTSGHPTRTTFGNSLRVILYYRYLFMKAGI